MNTLKKRLLPRRNPRALLLGGLLGLVLAGPAHLRTATAADDALAVTFTILETCAASLGGGSFALQLGGQTVGTLAGGNDCTCTPPLRTFTTSDPAALALVGPRGCAAAAVALTGSSYVAWARVAITRAQTGVETLCLHDTQSGSCDVTNLCSAGYQQYSNSTFSAAPADSDGDGLADCVDPDLDGDGVANAGDNCPGVSNPGQVDVDGDGTGDACQPGVFATLWQGSEARPHEVFPGGSLVLQASAQLPDGEPFPVVSATWDPGDGSGPQAISVANPRVLELTHTYQGAPGQPFTATIRAVDAQGRVYTDTFRVVLRPNTRETRVNMAIDRGLWNLHRRLSLSTTDGLASGYWTGYGQYQFVATASAVQAFQINGHRQSGDRARNPYVANVERGLRYILGEQQGRLARVVIGLQNGNDPDSNGNGYGLAVSINDHTNYVGGQLIDALVSSGTPNQVAEVGQPTYVRGRTYRDIVQDLLDGYSWGMNDAVGGWHYNFNVGDNDTSASHWWAIGVLAAELWGLDAPDWVKQIQWTVGIPRMQHPTSCYFGYTGSYNSTLWDNQMNVTAAGLILMNADDVDQNHPRFTCAQGWLNTYFNNQLGNFYTMYQLAKGMRTALDDTGATTPISLLNGTRDWYAAYADHLVGVQQASGAFPSTVGTTSSYITGDMASSWAIIILTPALFEQPPTAVCHLDTTIVCQVGAQGGCNADGADLYATVNADGSGSTPGDNPIASYSWNFQDGSPAVAGVAASHQFATAGTFDIRLTVTDTRGNSATAVCPVQVTAGALPPVADAGGPYEFCLGPSNQRIFLDGSGSYGRGSAILEYQWDWSLPIDLAPPPDSSLETPGDVTAVFGALGVGTHDLALRIVDDSVPPFGTTVYTTVTVRAADDPACPQNVPPVAIALPDGEVFECTSPDGALVGLDGTQSYDPDAGQVLSYAWSTGATTATSSGVYPIGSHQATLTVTDPFGVQHSDTAWFQVQDTTAPRVKCADATAECAGPEGTSVLLSASVADVCDPAPVVANLGPPRFPVGTTAVAWVAQDAAGNQSTCQAQVTVRDTQAPEVTCPADATLALDERCRAGATYVATAQDVCTGAQTEEHTFSFVAPGVQSHAYQFTDGNGNLAHCVQQVTASDAIPPVVTFCPAPATLALDERCLLEVAFVAEGRDNCSGRLTDSQAFFFAGGPGSAMREYTLTDASGNAVTCSQEIVAVDQTPPSLNCPAPITSECTGELAATVDPGPGSASDTCRGLVEVTDPAAASFPLGTTSVAYVAQDASGNQATCETQVVVQDTQPPQLTCPADVEVDADAACLGSSFGGATVVELCDPNVVVTQDGAGDQFPLGTTDVRFTATDSSGLTSECIQQVTVVDRAPPAIFCPPPLRVGTDPGVCRAELVLGVGKAEDNCDPQPVLTHDGAGVFDLGTTIIQHTATDLAGNTAQCQTTVEVVDDEAPTLLCPAPIVAYVDASRCGAQVAVEPLFVADNCDSQVSVSSDAPTLFGLGTTVVTLTATDDVGQVTQCTTEVTVLDTTDPEVNCPPAEVVVDAPADSCGASVSLEPTGTDSCDSELAVTSNAPAVYPVGSTAVTFWIADDWGNVTTCQSTVTVRDVAPPAITCPVDQVVAADPETCRQTVTLEATATDACGVAELLDSAGASHALGTTVHTFTALDASGNSSSCTTAVSVVDTTPPRLVTKPGPTLWPPNHQYRRVSASDCIASLTDGCNGQALDPVTIDDVRITRATSDELEDDRTDSGRSGNRGDGNTLNDIVFVGPATVDLRAERLGGGNGRVYTLHLTVRDQAGSETTGSCRVQVPHDQGQGSTAVEDAVRYSVIAP